MKELEPKGVIYTISYDETHGDQPVLSISRREENGYDKCVSYHGEIVRDVYTKLDIILQALLSD